VRRSSREGVRLKVLSEKYAVEEKDFLSAELELVPAGRARDSGWTAADHGLWPRRPQLRLCIL
jgi:aspartyl aminopeptidase